MQVPTYYRRVMTTFPDWVEPMAATLTQERFTGPEWIFERKFDGIRLLAFKKAADVRLLSRNRLPRQRIPVGRRGAVAELPIDDVILDGEATGGWAAQRRTTASRITSSTSSGSTAATSRSSRSTSGIAARQSLPLRPPLDASRRSTTGARGNGRAARAGKASSPSAVTRATSTGGRRTGSR